MRQLADPRELIGVVVATGAIGEAESAPAALKAALATIDCDPLFGGELLESLRWLARYTHAPLGEVLDWWKGCES